MFKRLALILVLVLALVVPSLACTIPAGVSVWAFTGPGGAMNKYMVNAPQEVILHAVQPTEEMLSQFSANASVTGDWSDGKVVTDTAGMNILIHESDLKCE
jgi:hypothetical protein